MKIKKIITNKIFIEIVGSIIFIILTIIMAYLVCKWCKSMPVYKCIKPHEEPHKKLICSGGLFYKECEEEIYYETKCESYERVK